MCGTRSRPARSRRRPPAGPGGSATWLRLRRLSDAVVLGCSRRGVEAAASSASRQSSPQGAVGAVLASESRPSVPWPNQRQRRIWSDGRAAAVSCGRRDGRRLGRLRPGDDSSGRSTQQQPAPCPQLYIKERPSAAPASRASSHSPPPPAGPACCLVRPLRTFTGPICAPRA